MNATIVGGAEARGWVQAGSRFQLRLEGGERRHGDRRDQAGCRRDYRLVAGPEKVGDEAALAALDTNAG